MRAVCTSKVLARPRTCYHLWWRGLSPLAPMAKNSIIRLEYCVRIAYKFKKFHLGAIGSNCDCTMGKNYVLIEWIDKVKSDSDWIGNHRRRYEKEIRRSRKRIVQRSRKRIV